MQKQFKKIKLKTKGQRGSIFVDVLVAFAIVGFSFAVFLQVGEVSIKLSSILRKKTDAMLLVQQGIETVRSFRDGTDWAEDGIGSLPTETIYHVVLDTGTSPATLSFESGEEILGIYTRKIVIDPVSRDQSGNIEASYNLLNDDSNTRKITVTVEWENSSVKTIAYLTNWQ